MASAAQPDQTQTTEYFEKAYNLRKTKNYAIEAKHFVTIAVSMPYSKVRQERVCNLACYLTNQTMIHPCIHAEFDTAEQDKYKTAVARAPDASRLPGPAEPELSLITLRD